MQALGVFESQIRHKTKKPHPKIRLPKNCYHRLLAFAASDVHKCRACLLFDHFNVLFFVILCTSGTAFYNL